MKSDNSNISNSNNKQNLNAQDFKNNQIPIQIRRVNMSANNSESKDSASNSILSDRPVQPVEIEMPEIVADVSEIEMPKIITEPLESDPVGSNRNVVNEDTIIKEPAIRLNTETLKQYLKPIDKIDSQNHNLARDTEKPWEIDRKNGSKVYELIGYTTLSKIRHGVKKENQQSLLKRILITLMLFVIIFIILYAMNPIKDLIDFRRIIGIKSMYGENYIDAKNNNESNAKQEISDTNAESQESTNTAGAE
ncbi:MAG TPA: hypothetical protein GXZ76_03795 [Clostridiaceae bacterium]|nr:hypothetical protein [Clostridiaceae bacterium]